MRAQNCSIDAGSSAAPLRELAFILVLTVLCVGYIFKSDV